MFDQYVKIESPLRTGYIRAVVYRYNTNKKSYAVYDVYEGKTSLDVSMWLFDNNYGNIEFHDDNGVVSRNNMSTIELIDYCNNFIHNKFN